MLPNKLLIIFLSLAIKNSHIYIPKILQSILKVLQNIKFKLTLVKKLAVINHDHVNGWVFDWEMSWHFYTGVNATLFQKGPH